MATVYLSLGSNLGNRYRNLRAAIKKINELVGVVERQSAFLETEPWGYASCRRYLNACIRVKTNLTPRRLLEVTQQIERDLGRTAKTTRTADGTPNYADRTIDIDILLYDQLRVDEPDLKIPHPLMHERQFVMQPLKEIMEE